MRFLLTCRIIIIIFILIFSNVSGQSFKIPLTVTDGTYSMTLYFGMHPDASDGYDPGHDAYAPPPPPAGAFDARFSIQNEDYLTDIRDSIIVTKEYLLKYAASGSGPIILHWDSRLLAGYGSFSITDAYGGDNFQIDMTIQDSLDTIESVYLDQELTIRMTPVLSTIKSRDTFNRPESFNLFNYPNPFNSTTEVTYSLNQNTMVRLFLINALGQIINELYFGRQRSGRHVYNLDLTEYATGTYYVVLKTNEKLFSLKMTQLK